VPCSPRGKWSVSRPWPTLSRHQQRRLFCSRLREKKMLRVKTVAGVECSTATSIICVLHHCASTDARGVGFRLLLEDLGQALSCSPLR
jgi:hypothetical protein